MLNLVSSREKNSLHLHNKFNPALADAPFPSSHLRKAAIHKYMQHDWARSRDNAQNTRRFSSSLAPSGRIYSLTSLSLWLEGESYKSQLHLTASLTLHRIAQCL